LGWRYVPVMYVYIHVFIDKFDEIYMVTSQIAYNYACTCWNSSPTHFRTLCVNSNNLVHVLNEVVVLSNIFMFILVTMQLFSLKRSNLLPFAGKRRQLENGGKLKFVSKKCNFKRRLKTPKELELDDCRFISYIY